jgi:hypothetical protein
MKKILLYLSILVMPAFGQTPGMQWERSINGNSSSDDYPVKSVKDASGNLYVTGYQVGSEVFLVKYDNNGNQLYRITYFGPGLASCRPSDLTVDNNGNAYVGGSSYSPITGFSSNMLIKFNPNGNKVWEYYMSPNYSTYYPVTFSSITLDKTTNPNYIYATGAHNDSIVVNKISIINGTSVWIKKIERGTVVNVKTDNSGNPFICGLTRKNFNTNGEDGFVAKLNSNGNIAWTQSFNGASDTADVANNIEILNNGSVMVAGNVRDSVGSGLPWVKMIYISVSGLISWSKDYHTLGCGSNEETDMTMDPTQTIFYVTYNGTQLYSPFKTISYIQNVDLNGNLINRNSFAYGTAQDTKAFDVELDIYGNIYVLGTTRNNSNYLCGYLWKNGSALNTIASSVYSTLNSNAIVYQPSGLMIDNAGNPYGAFQTYNYNNTSNHDDVVLVKFNSSCSVTWEVFYNGKDYSTNNTTGLFVDGANNAYVAGTVDNTYTQSDAVIAKYDAMGNQQWINTFDYMNGTNYAGGIAADAQVNIYLLSQSYASSNLLKYDSSGNQLWNTLVPLKSNLVILDASGNAHLAAGANPLLYNVINSRSFATAVVSTTGSLGATGTLSHDTGYFSYPVSVTLDNNQNTFILGTLTNTSYWNANVLLQKFNASAQSTWYYKLAGMDSTVSEQARAAKVIYNAGDGFLYAICSATKQGATVSTEFILKINPNTNAVTTYSYNASGSNSYATYNAVISPANEIYITGRASNTIGGYYFYVHKFDNAGNLLWEKLFQDSPSGNNPYSAGQGITLDATGNVYATGFLSGTQSGTLNLHTVKISSTGVTLWNTAYDGPINGDDYGKFISVTANHRIYVAANVESGPYQGVNQDIALLKYCDLPAAIVSYSGSTNICQNSSITLSAAVSGAGNIMWSNGALTPTITVNTTANYYFTYTEHDGCSENSDSVKVNIKSAPLPVQICMVTVDDSSKHNLVLWNKTLATPDVIGFNVYREDLTNIYHQVGAVPITSLSEFIDLDPTANPNANTKRYKITTVDSCGNESQLSNYHNTVYIVSNGGGQFSWNQLYTIENSPNPVVQYILFRDDYNTNSWHAIDSTAGTQFNINDINFATFQPTANWRVATQWNISCTPTARQGYQTQASIVKSKSNIINNRVISVGNLNDKNVLVYPNPAQNMLIVNIPAASKTSFKLMSLLGDEIYAMEISNTSTQQIDVSKLVPGTYLLQIKNDSGNYIKRIVKE